MGKHEHHNKHRIFDIVVRDYGHGATSKVSIVRRKSDGELFIWKQPVNDDYYCLEAIQKVFRYSKYWRKFGISKVEVYWCSDKRSILKTYIKGKTLGDMLKEGSLRFSIDDQSLGALRKFFGLLIGSKHYIVDLAIENLVFDGKMWHVIDSGSIGEEDSRSNVRQKYKKVFLENWSQGPYSNDDIRHLELLLDSTKPIKYQNSD